MGDGKEAEKQAQTCQLWKVKFQRKEAHPLCPPQLHTRQRVEIKSLSPGDVEGAQENGRDRMSTGLNDALDIQGWKR